MASRSIIDDLSVPQRALVLAADHLGGGAAEQELQKVAAELYEGFKGIPSTLHNHYSRAADQLQGKGLFRAVHDLPYVEWWLTDAGWRALGHRGKAPTTRQGTLL